MLVDIWNNEAQKERRATSLKWWKKNQPRILYSTKYILQGDKAKTKLFSDKTNVKKKNPCQQASTTRNTKGMGEQLHHGLMNFLILYMDA